jgi:hypothetical protein
MLSPSHRARSACRPGVTAVEDLPTWAEAGAEALAVLEAKAVRCAIPPFTPRTLRNSQGWPKVCASSHSLVAPT